MPQPPHDTLLSRAQTGQRRAIARLLSALEDNGPDAGALVSACRAAAQPVAVIGVTGPPGAGKSTLVDRIVTALRAAGHRVGVVAVDPSSPVSGGAILGDRLRMARSASDDDVLIRSLSASGFAGGITPAAVRLIDGFAACGFDRVVIETVGTGQNEVDVAAIADVRVVVAAPGLGDDIQAMKSGLLEIADVLVVNKADRPGAEQTRQQLAGAQSLATGGAHGVPVLKVSAAQNTGVDELMIAVAAALDARAADSAARGAARARYVLRQMVIRRVERLSVAPELAGMVAAIADDLVVGRIDVVHALDQLNASDQS